MHLYARTWKISVGGKKHAHMYLNTAHISLASACVALSYHHCVRVSLCELFERCTCISASKPHLQFTAASLAHCHNLCPLTLLFFLFSSVHCFGLQLLYLFRLTGGLALPLGFRMGNGKAEKGIDNRTRQGLDHARYPPPKYYSTMYPPPKKRTPNRTCSFPFLFISFVSIPCHSAFAFSLFLSHSILFDSVPPSLFISPLSGLAERRSGSD